MKGIIYKWTCLKSGKSYIGQTINEKRREKEFFSDSECYTTEGSKIDNARKKYGLSKDVWKKDVLKRLWCKDGKEEGLLERLNYWEKYYIKEFDTLKNGYNSTDGGSNGFLVSEEVKEKCINAGKTWWNSLTDVEKEKWRKKGIDLWNSLSDEEKTRRGKLNIFYGKHQNSENNEISRKLKTGKIKSEETKEKIRQSVLKRKHLVDDRKKVYQINPTNGSVINIYNSLTDAEQNGWSIKSIKTSFRTGKIYSGYIWKIDETTHKAKEPKGYFWYWKLKKFKSRITYMGKKYNLGFFKNEIAAHEMYKLACANKENFLEWFKDIEAHKKFIFNKYENSLL